jgi:hypothetical protein
MSRCLNMYAMIYCWLLFHDLRLARPFVELVDKSQITPRNYRKENRFAKAKVE